MPNLKEIGEAAGVSPRTAARALKGNGYVSPEVRRRVRQIAKQLGYRPNPLAQALRTGISREVVVVLFETDELHMAKVAGLEHTLRQHGFWTKVLCCQRDETELRKAAAELSHQQIAGLVLDGFLNELPVEVYRLFDELNIPTVILDARGSNRDGSYLDRSRGISDAVHYLADCGYKRVAYLGLPTDPGRIQGYTQAMESLGRPGLLIPYVDQVDRFAAGREAVAAFLAMEPRPDAIQAYSDEVALGFLNGLHARGIKVPEEVALIGFDNRQASAWSFPALTTIAQPNEEVGAVTAELLLEQLRGEAEPTGGWKRLIRPQLIVRGTTPQLAHPEGLSS